MNDEICNGPLREGTEYEFKYRAYNSEDNNAYAESAYSAPISTGIIVIITQKWVLSACMMYFNFWIVTVTLWDYWTELIWLLLQTCIQSLLI